MPQKKNPDVLEVIRARISHVLGNFVTSAATLKALPSGYNLDFQEITPKLWESLEIVGNSLGMLSKLVMNLKLQDDVLAKPQFSFLAATELANMLVRKYKVPFRSAHKIVGSMVRELINKGLTLNSGTAELLNKTANSFGFTLNVKDEDLKEATDILKIVESHNVMGGPSPNEVNRMLKTRKEWTFLAKSKLSKRRLEVERTYEQLQSIIKSYLTSANSEPQTLKSQKS
jgi:argininosuccinate lyase